MGFQISNLNDKWMRTIIFSITFQLSHNNSMGTVINLVTLKNLKTMSEYQKYNINTNAVLPKPPIHHLEEVKKGECISNSSVSGI